MLHKSELKLKCDTIETSHFADENVFRQMASDLLNGMSMQELQKIFKFKKTDSNSEETLRKIRDDETDDYEKKRLIDLRLQRLVLYEVEVNL